MRVQSLNLQNIIVLTPAAKVIQLGIHKALGEIKNIPQGILILGEENTLLDELRQLWFLYLFDAHFSKNLRQGL